MSSRARELEYFAKTIYAEARGESDEGQLWVAWVIKNRVLANRSYWGGNTYEGVCRAPKQFECWEYDMTINEQSAYRKACAIAERVYDASRSQDPTGGCDHYHNLTIKPEWTQKCTMVRRIKNHIFYRANC